MDSNYIITKILSNDEVLYLKNIINSDKDFWMDGLKTITNGDKTIKNNLEMYVNTEIGYKVNEFVMEKISSNEKLCEYCIPYNFSNIIISKTLTGGYYKLHNDSGFIGDYSTTLFISNKSEYEGGELSLFIDGEEKKFKLESGFAITYKTGIPHQVNKVLSGERIVSVFWTHSRFQDPVIREIYKNAMHLDNLLHQIILDNDFEDEYNNPKFIISNIQNILSRRFSKL
jgi:PKHD-type hydroxylase